MANKVDIVAAQAKLQLINLEEEDSNESCSSGKVAADQSQPGRRGWESSWRREMANKVDIAAALAKRQRINLGVEDDNQAAALAKLQVINPEGAGVELFTICSKLECHV
jgi:hypothetical protein